MAEQETILECWGILIILAIVSLMFIRAHKGFWAKTVIPLTFVPLVTIIYNPINRRIMQFNSAEAEYIRLIIYFVTFAVTCVLVVVWGQKLPVGKSKIVYMVLGIAFSLALILIFIRNLIIRPLYG